MPIGAVSASIPQPAVAVGLPRLAGGRIESRQPASTPAESIDADQVAKIEDLAVLKRRVPHDSRFSRLVRLRNVRPERLPAHGLPVLLDERPIGLVAGMNEEVAVGFEAIAPRTNKLDVLVGDGLLFSLGISVRLNGLLTTAGQPIVRLRAAIQKVKHHLFVIAQ